MGHDVVVIEKSDHLGGHANTYVDPASGTPINVGVQVFENTSIVLAHFADLGVPVLSVPATNQPKVDLDFTRGAAVSNYTPLTGEQIGTTLSAYAAILTTNYSYLADGFNLPDPVPDELLQPFGEFAEKHGLQDMAFVCSTYE
jgi:phytoene dehydrogenase-like protein